jgi:hypothetical protein
LANATENQVDARTSGQTPTAKPGRVVRFDAEPDPVAIDCVSERSADRAPRFTPRQFRAVDYARTVGWTLSLPPPTAGILMTSPAPRTPPHTRAPSALAHFAPKSAQESATLDRARTGRSLILFP